MPLHALATAAALTSPLVGHQTARADGTAVDRPLTLVDRTTLKRVPKTPVLPDGEAEFSPDGARYVVPGNGRLTVYATASGRRSGTIDGGSDGVLSWISPRRLLRMDSETVLSPTTVTVIDPVRRRVIGAKTYAGDSVTATSRLGDRQLMVVNHQAADGSSEEQAVVLDPDGRVRHRIELPDVLLPTLKGRLVGGVTRGTQSKYHVYAVDVRKGTIRSHVLRGFGRSSGRFLGGTTSPSLLEGARGYAFVAPRTGAVLRRFDTRDPGYAFGAPGGYVTVTLGATLSRTVAGRVRWRRRNPGRNARDHRPQTRVFGNRIYQQFYADSGTGRSFLRILSLETGRTLREIPGEFVLSALSQGRDVNQVQSMFEG